MATYLCVSNSRNNETKRYTGKVSAQAPYLKVNNEYFPLTTETTTAWGLRINSNNQIYRIVESYTTTATESMTYSVSTTSLTRTVRVVDHYESTTSTNSTDRALEITIQDDEFISKIMTDTIYVNNSSINVYSSKAYSGQSRSTSMTKNAIALSGTTCNKYTAFDGWYSTSYVVGDEVSYSLCPAFRITFSMPRIITSKYRLINTYIINGSSETETTKYIDVHPSTLFTKANYNTSINIYDEAYANGVYYSTINRLSFQYLNSNNEVLQRIPLDEEFFTKLIYNGYSNKFSLIDDDSATFSDYIQSGIVYDNTWTGQKYSVSTEWGGYATTYNYSAKLSIGTYCMFTKTSSFRFALMSDYTGTTKLTTKTVYSTRSYTKTTSISQSSSTISTITVN